MRCDDVSLLLAESVDPLGTLPLPADVHLRACLRCQAELAQYRKLMRAMRSLRHQQVPLDATSPAFAVEDRDDAIGELLEVLRPPASVHRLHGHGRRRAYISGIAAAATAGAAGALVLASRVTRQTIAS